MADAWRVFERIADIFSLDEIDVAATAVSDKLLALDEALGRMSEQDPTKAQLVKLRYFAGLTIEEATHSLGISTATADRYWAYARAWLQAEMCALTL